jgi:hypothetical protein
LSFDAPEKLVTVSLCTWQMFKAGSSYCLNTGDNPLPKELQVTTKENMKGCDELRKPEGDGQVKPMHCQSSMKYHMAVTWA